jgi:inosine-uridine nucleoside N-ribohydrolase
MDKSVDNSRRQKLILDVDTGFDDAAAILLAGHHPALELMAVTVTHGNAPLSVTLDNTLRTMRVGGLSQLPVYPGAERALLAVPPPTEPLQQRSLDLPPSALTAQPRRAAEFLVEYYLGQHGPDTVYVPVGPQTNLALALRLESRLAARIPRIVTMAGAYIEGNVTPSAEFNVLADPEAAHIVFNSGIPITMIGLEVTAQALVTMKDLEHLRALSTPWANAVAAIIEPNVRWWIDNQGWSGGQVYDACAVAAVIEPGILQTKPMRVDIELHGEHTRGRTVADISGWQKKAPNVEVGVGIQRNRFIEILLTGLR